MDKKYEKGFADSKPLYVIDEETGELIELYFPLDAIASEAGFKAGNPHLDRINKKLRESNLIETMKLLYKINKLEKKINEK